MTLLAWTCNANGSPAHTTAGTALAIPGRIPDRPKANWWGTVNKDLDKRRGSPARKQETWWQLLTDTDSAGLWLSVSSWTWDQSTSKSKSYNTGWKRLTIKKLN